jgi:hypothetical protein
VPISLHCACGKAFRVKDEFAGKKIRCTGCKQVLAVPLPELETAKSTEDEALNFLLTESPPLPTKRPAKARPDEESQETSVTAEPPPRPASKRPAKEKEKKKSGSSLSQVRWSQFDKPREREERHGRSFRLVLSPTIITGLLMMLGAVVWFGAGLAIGFIYFYPPVLFVLGIAAVFRGLMGQED